MTRRTAESNPAVRDFIADPDTYLKAHPEVRIILASPSLQSGVSITEAVYGSDSVRYGWKKQN
ncbi:hypothetical protein [Chroococcidiopsis sp. CCMEE 29]|uniref:hypothetical protein n=1 Tax=Chroococcidiopsis sp. CCMEE 29 TaxID=155894 RepID=UPI002021ACFE|nr:hypothetical protein [Chroococcidiopsis sp. CCMEE 29]